MGRKYVWSKYLDDEVWYGGPCDSIKECAEEALNEDYTLDDTFALGYKKEYNIDYDFAFDIVDKLRDDAGEEVGEASDGWLDSVNSSHLEMLNERITPIIKEWLNDIGETPWFYGIEPFTSCTIKEALELTKHNKKGGKSNVQSNP